VKPIRITAGALHNLHLSEIAQMLALGGKTACVTVASNGREGRVWFRDGAVAHARVGEERGEEAFYELLGWRAGRFFIEHGSTTQRQTIDKDTMYLLMEGLRRDDEAGRWVDRSAPSLDETPALLEILATSRIETGRLTLFVDGEEIRNRDLAVPNRGTRRLLSWLTGGAEERFDERVAMAPGPHLLVARLERSGNSRVERSIEVQLSPGEVATRHLLLGPGQGRDVIWTEAGRNRQPWSEK